MSLDYPRVTEILRYYTEYHKIPAIVLERASSRGTAVHAICAGIAKGAWVPDGMIQEGHLGYVNSFRKWMDAQIDTFPVVEQRMADSTLKYTGQIDFVVKCKDGELYLVDIKTSAAPQKTYPLQIAAYENLLRLMNIRVKGCMLVYLNKDGEFPNIHAMDDVSEEFGIFLSALDCYNYFNKRKKKDG